MTKLVFNSSPTPSLGVELEMALVDNKTMALASAIEPLLERVPPAFRSRIKPELMQCYLEVTTGICTNVGHAERQLRESIELVEGICDSLDLSLYWTGTHPFSLWRDQQLVPNERYESLISILQDMARQLVTFGLHVHVGVDSGDKAVMICDRIMRHLPTLLALSCNSPWWENRVTGLQSHRTKIMECLPTAGLPTLMRNWSEFVWLVNHLVDTGFINTIREIWWDVRPHHSFGTVEVRVCDMPGNLTDSLALTALIHCLVKNLSDEIDEGTYQHDCHPMMVRQNKWRACRYGTQTRLVDAYTYEQRTVGETVDELLAELAPTAEELGCRPYLEHVRKLAHGPSWADRQLAILHETGDSAEVVRRMAAESRLTPVLTT